MRRRWRKRRGRQDGLVLLDDVVSCRHGGFGQLAAKLTKSPPLSHRKGGHEEVSWDGRGAELQHGLFFGLQVVFLQGFDGVGEPRVSHPRGLSLKAFGREGGTQKRGEVRGSLAESFGGFSLEVCEVMHTLEDPEVCASHGERVRVGWRREGGMRWVALSGVALGGRRREAAFEARKAACRAEGSPDAH